MPSFCKARHLPSVCALALGAWGCGASSPPEPSVDPVATEAVHAETEPPETHEAPAIASSATPTSPHGLYEVHEWGVLDVQEDGSAELAAGAGRPPAAVDMMPMRKPVIYFHLTPGIDSLAVDVRARILSGTIYETFPADTRPSLDVAAWRGALSPGPCPTNPATRDLPTTRRGPIALCTTPDGICESSELPRYDAATASCIEVGGVRAGMLFYRGMLRPDLPLTVTRRDDMSVLVTATGETAGAPGAVLRISTNLSGPWPIGHVVISRAELPRSGASVTLPVGTVAVDRSATRAELAVGLRALGLDDAETDAFLGAWMVAFFGAEPGASGRADDGTPPVPRDAILYFLPESGADRLSTLELTPPPRRVRRVFMVRVILPSVTTA